MKKALSLVLALLMLMSLCITPVMAAEPEGSESNPYYVANPMAAPGFITIPANSAVYYQYNAAVFNGWEVGGYGLTSIIVDGVVYDTPDMWGEIYAPLNFNMMSPGIVAYVNDTAEDVQVMISHNEPLGTENNPDTMEDGENAFSIPANNPSYVVDYVPTANGEYTFSTEQSEDFIISIDIDGTAYTLDGSLTLELESYIPVRFYISPIGVTGDIVLTVTPPKAGTEGNPHWLEVDTLYEINGTEPTYFQVDGSLSGNELLIESFNGTELTITLDGVEYITKGGALYVPLETENWVMDLVISQTSSDKNTVYFSIEYAEGTEQNPIKLVDGDNEISIPEGAETYYYEYTVESESLLVITPADAAAFGQLDAYCDADTSYAYLQEGASSVILPVSAGATVLISACGVTDEETWINGAVDTVLNIAVKDLALFSNFDSGELPEGWKLTTGGLSGVSDDISNSGFYSLKLEGDAYAEILYTAPVAQIEGVTYTVEFDVNAITSGGINFQVKRCPGDDPTKGGNLMNEYIDVIGGEWQHYTYTFDADITPDRDHFSLLFVVSDGTDFYLDNVSVTYTEKSSDPSFDGYIYNGDFETGKVEPWDNLWGSCPTVEIISGGKDSDYALHVVSGQWLHVRQTGIAVEPNTDYKITAWAKDAKDMSLLVKDGGDTKDLKNAGVNAGAEWTQFTAEFNTGDYTTIIFSLMGSTADAYGTFDNIVIEKIEGGDDPVDPPVDENLGENIFAGGDFTDGANDWNLDSGGSTIVAEDGVGHIDFNADWGYAMKGTSVSSNTDYRLSFRAKAINGSGMNVNFKNGSWADCGIDSYKGSIAADWTEYTYDFNSGDNNYLLLFFQSGHYGSDDFQVWIDDIRVQEILATDPGDEPTIDPPVPPEVPENAIVNDNFDDGETQGWSSSSTIAVVDGVLEFQCTQSWANIYKYVNAMKPNTDYVYRFNARANMKQTMNIKVNNNWAGDTGKGIVDVTTEWQTYEVVVNSGDLTSTALVLFSSNVEASAGLVLYLDNISIAEVKDELPEGYVCYEDFENGTGTWGTNADATIETVPYADVPVANANGGDYALKHTIPSGKYPFISDRTPYAVEPNTDYTISIDVLNTKSNWPIQILVGTDYWFGGSVYNSDAVVPGTSAWGTYTFHFNSGDNTQLYFGMKSQWADTVVYFDNFTVSVKTDDPVNPDDFDSGLIENGGFETGNESGWEIWQSTEITADAAHSGKFGAHLQGNGSWGGMLNQTVTVIPGKTYKLSFWINVVATGCNVQVKDGSGVAIEDAGGWFDANNVDKLVEWTFVATDDSVFINFCGGGNGNAESVYVDDFSLIEIEADEPDVEAVWSADFNDGDKKFNAGEVVAEGPDGSNCLKWTASGGWSAIYVVLKNMDPGKDYSITMKVKASIDGTMGVTIQNGDWGSYWNAPTFAVTTEWKDVVYTIPANSIPFNAGSILFKFQDVGQAMDLYVDDIVIVEGLLEVPGDVDSSFDGYIYNGDFETGDLTNWINLYGACTVEFVEGYESDYAMSVVMPKQWQQVRQDKIAVEANTTYRLSAYVKNAQNVAFVIKEGNDSFDLTPSEIGAFPAGDEWQLFSMEFNTGVNKNGEAVTVDSICILVISYDENGGSVIIDNITLEKVEEIEPEYLPGDVSDDGRVNNRDLGMLQQYLSDMDVKITNMNACDVTGDGRVNNRDLGVLQQYLSDMDVELKYGAIEE